MLALCDGGARLSMPLRLVEVPKATLTLGRTFGMRGTALRALHECRRKLGLFHEAPSGFDARAALRTRPFAVDARSLAGATGRDEALARAERVLDGFHQAYRWQWRKIPDTPKEWLRDPATNRLRNAYQPWWQVTHLERELGDIKDLWEPARFAWAYDLIRAYLLTSDARYARCFDTALASWVESSPAFLGPHWSCGQEAAVRAAALLYAESNLEPALAEIPGALERLQRTLAATGERIADSLGYAESQRNNHAISEAMGLVVLGQRFSEEHPDARRWLREGHRRLNRLIPAQFASDGWYIQHSFNYLRLALDQAVIAERALRACGLELSAASRDRLLAAAELLTFVMEPASGRVPNHGGNDGAFVHPITLADYRDFRPTLTAVSAMWRHPLPRSIAPDREVLAWLGADPPPEAPPLSTGVRRGPSGWVVLQSRGASAFLRAGRYRSRPGHLDALHVDLSFGGHEVVVDPGTFVYHAPPPWRNALAAAEVHNGPILDDTPPGKRGPRFLWWIWPEASVEQTRTSEGVLEAVARRADGVERRVLVHDDRVDLQDVVLAESARRLRIAWLVHPDVECRLTAGNTSARCVRPTEASPEGWFSPRYGERIPGTLIELRERVSRGARITTSFTFSPGTRVLQVTCRRDDPEGGPAMDERHAGE